MSNHLLDHLPWHREQQERELAEMDRRAGRATLRFNTDGTVEYVRSTGRAIGRRPPKQIKTEGSK